VVFKKYIAKDEFHKFRTSIKLTNCPHCRKIGMLILFGYLRGYNEKHNKNIRAHRIFCSNRNKRTGCGKTFSVYYSNFIKNITIGSDIGWQFLENMLITEHIEKSYLNLISLSSISLELSTLFRFWKKFITSLYKIRTNLINTFSLNKTITKNATLETINHLSTHLSYSAKSPISVYHIFQESFV